jgi:hypothetical protein
LVAESYTLLVVLYTRLYLPASQFVPSGSACPFLMRVLENLVVETNDLAPSNRLALRASVRFWADVYMRYAPVGADLVSVGAMVVGALLVAPRDRACKKSSSILLASPTAA